MDWLSYILGGLCAFATDSLLFSQRFNPIWRRIREKKNQSSK